MSLPDGLRDREYQFYKDRELFGSATPTSGATGSIVLNTATPRVGDLLIINAGSGDINYNLGVSGGAVAVSVSGILLAAGRERAYNDVGFDVVAYRATGSTSIYIHKIYTARG